MNKISDFFKKNNKYLPTVYIVLGILMFFMPGITLKIVSLVLGISMILEGISKVKENKTSGAFYIIFGIIFVLNTRLIGSLTASLLGIVLLLKGIENYNRAKQMKELKIMGYVAEYIIAVATIVLSVIILIQPFGMAKFITSIISAVLIYLGITEILFMSAGKKMEAEIIDADDKCTPIDE